MQTYIDIDPRERLLFSHWEMQASSDLTGSARLVPLSSVLRMYDLLDPFMVNSVRASGCRPSVHQDTRHLLGDHAVGRLMSHLLVCCSVLDGTARRST